MIIYCEINIFLKMWKKLFDKSKEQESDHEDEEEEDQEETQEEENVQETVLFDETPLARQSWNDKTCSYYFKQIREVAPFLSTWSFNRNLNVDHKNSLKSSLLQSSNPHLMGTIQCVRDQQQHIRVINGQHRLQALLEVLREDLTMTFNMGVMFEVYDIPIDDMRNIDIDVHTIEEIYETANKSLAFNPEQETDLYCRFIIKAMNQDPVLKKGLVDKDDGKVYRPRILSKQLYEEFKAYISPQLKLPVPEVIQRIKQINVDLSLMSSKQLFGRSKETLGKSKAAQRERAAKIQFFLNLDSKYPPSVWIQWI